MDAVEDIKARLSIEDVASKYVELKRAGRNFKALSPFGNEKTPSLMISPEKQIWHDFSSGKGGTMFSFVMEMEGVDFKEALEILARQAGIDLTQYRRSGTTPQHSQQRERVFQALELATKFYQIQFSKYRPALEYVLGKRKFTKHTALEFRIGYSPESGQALTQFLLKKGFSQADIKAAGLGTQRRVFGDMFRGRVMIPLMDAQGRVIGFTARLLADDPNAPKYINTPQTIAYDKSRHVFGLHLAKDAIRKLNYAVVVEGNLDVIASHQAGVRQTVATAGTAMTDQHLKALSRFTQDIRLAFDQDGAGIAATERAIPLATKASVSLSIIDIEGAKDPDELIQSDPKAWQVAVTKHLYAVDWLISQYQKRLDLSSGQGKRQFTDVLLAVIKTLDDSVEQDHYLGTLADLLNISKDALRTKLQQTSRAPQPRSEQRKQVTALKADPLLSERRKTENQLLALTALHTDVQTMLQPITADMLTQPDAVAMLKYLQTHPGYVLKADASNAPKTIGDFAQILLLLHEQLYQDLETIELHDEATRLQVRLIDLYVKFKKAALSEAFKTADADATQQLLQEVKALNSLLH